MIIERIIKGFGLVLGCAIVALLIVATVQQAAIQRGQEAQDAILARHSLELDVLRAQITTNQIEGALIRAYLENPYRTQPGASAVLPKREAK